MSILFESVKRNEKVRETLFKVNSFMLNKRNAMIVEETGKNDVTYCFEANVTQLGFRFSDELRKALLNLDAGTMIVIYNDTLEALRIEKGVDVDHSNFIFPGFPNETRMKDLSTLSKLRFLGYLADELELTLGDEFHSALGLGKYAEHPERTPLEIDMDELIELKLGTIDDFYQIIYNLIGSRMALSEYDKTMVEYALKNEFLDNSKMVPDTIPFKETWAWLLRMDMDLGLGLNIEFKNFIDFKRAYAGLIGEDVSLSQNFKLKNLKNKERLYLLSKLEEACVKYPKFVEESMKKEIEFAKLINNRLHPTGTLSKRFPTVAKFFTRVIEGDKFYSTKGQIEKYLLDGKGYEAMKLAIYNPGDAIRRLAFALSIENLENQKKILDLVLTVAPQVDLSVLITTQAYFNTCNNSNIRVAKVKGEMKKSVLFLDKKVLSEEICKLASDMLQKAIETKLSTKAPITKKVYVDEVLKNYIVPFSTKDESKSFRTLTRGSRIDMGDTDVIRAFVYKKIRTGGYVDLSIAFLTSEFDFVDQCSWTSLKVGSGNKVLSMHSGDGYNCQNGLDELIDIDLPVLRELKETDPRYKNVRYIAFEVLSYSHIPFDKMERCFFGVMNRKSMFSDKVGDIDGTHSRMYHTLTPEQQAKIDFKGEVYEPSTVKFRFDLTSSDEVVIPLVYDLETNQMIWFDLAMRAEVFRHSGEKAELLSDGKVIPPSNTLCIENLQNGLKAACYSIVYLQKGNLYDLFCSNVRARGGELVSSKEEAELVCSLEGDVTPFYRDVITKEWM